MATVAYEVPVLDIGLHEAGADLSVTGQYRWVKLDTAEKIQLCNVAGELALGILQNAPKLGEAASVRILGISKIVLAGNEDLKAGDTVGTEATGAASKINMNITGADLGDVINGQMMLNGKGGAIGTVLVRPLGRVTA